MWNCARWREQMCSCASTAGLSIRALNSVKIAFIAILGLISSACDIQKHENLISYGVGTQLYTTEVAQTTENLET